MAVLTNLFRRLRFWKRTTNETVNSSDNDFVKTLKQYEYFIYRLHHILMWENPSETLSVVAAVHILFWIFSSLEWRFYGILFTGLLLSTLHEIWTQQIWPEIRAHEPSITIDDLSEDNPQHESLLRLSNFLERAQKAIKDNYIWLKNMREQRPGTFCCVMSGIFLSLSFVGKILPGLVLVYMIVMAIVFAPGIWVHILSEDSKNRISKNWDYIKNSIYMNADDLPSEEDYLPEPSYEELVRLSRYVESQNSNEDLHSQGSSSTTHLSFATGISVMPSHEDNSVASSATFSDLELNLENIPKSTKRDIDESSDDSSMENDIGIDFRSTHFNGDDTSAEEDEREFTKDLKYTEADLTISSEDLPQSSTSLNETYLIQSTISNFIADNLSGLSAIGQSYIGKVLNRNINKTDKLTKNNSSDSLCSDEDFEMIRHEDVS